MRTSAFAITLAALCPASANAADLIRKRTSPMTQRVSTASRRANNDSDPFHRVLVTESLSFSMAADIEQADISLSLVLEVADISMSLPEDISMSLPEDLTNDIGSLAMPSDEPTPLPEEPQIDVLPEGPEALPAPLPPNPVVSSG